ncbi:MAG: hypothetical protein UU05_C0018G0021 [Candidatus Curtissbacteria bacterium GW2011_GWA1_40_47]|nr:MAG: hypothetical protein UT95_C0012G0030 [Candidatus Curtissbacteria bacterium GW2011_GWB1_40_28]KKR60801.1 MAG: hypothetical protein UT99_C0007G0021 [Candidatus Curtissbacteria bacterium GW2011_GWA2_40_31]KKR61542.1 MAG: hypothetical protein UU00_C0012G0025 [Microgenomates group bacterium GW2011_GWC1_40_35]KKR65450.1 MAG: hypothetical protein UU05_C0018G0021 [Candidatus Curtissbacteria bacterium GW2011_GWA1_40_47]KKR77477.1 MAG: hypothetical protein UU19_C0010G0023 [Candidatus Curtissbacte
MESKIKVKVKVKTLLFFERSEKFDSSCYGEYQTVLSYARTI